MEIRKVKGLYFSGTGTTEKIVARVTAELARRLGAERTIYDFTTPAARQLDQFFSADTLAVVGVPVYAGRVPNVLAPYLKEKVCGEGGGLAIPIVLYGNRNFDDGLIELRDILEADGLRTAAAAAFTLSTISFRPSAVPPGRQPPRAWPR